MLVDPIRTNALLAVAGPAPIRASNARPQTADSSTPSVRSAKPALVAPPGTPEDVKVQWDVDNGVVLKFTDKRSGEVVRQIPSEQVLSVVRFIRQLLDEDQTAEASNKSR